MDNQTKSRLTALRWKFILQGVLRALMIMMLILALLGLTGAELSTKGLIVCTILNALIGMVGGNMNFDLWKRFNKINYE